VSSRCRQSAGEWGGDQHHCQHTFRYQSQGCKIDTYNLQEAHWVGNRTHDICSTRVHWVLVYLAAVETSKQVLRGLLLLYAAFSCHAAPCCAMLCRNVFGKSVKPLHAPGFARNFMQLLRREGGVVFTNGDLDGWAGGSLGLGASNSNGDEQQAPQDGREAAVHVSSTQQAAAAADSSTGGSSGGAATSISRRKGSGTTAVAPGKPSKASATKAAPPSKGVSKGVSSRVTATQPTQVPHRQDREEGEEELPGVGQGGGGSVGGPGVPPQHPPYDRYNHNPADDTDRSPGRERDALPPQSGSGGLPPALERVAFITYRNASHCTDTHTYAWQTPGEPPEWKAQRAEAMDRAAAFAMPFRLARLRDLRADPLLPLVPETEQAV
jgi:hypothetical protein